MACPSWSDSHSCMRMKGSRPFCVSLLHGFGRDSMSLTLPCDRPSTWGPAAQEGWVSRPLEHRPSPPLFPKTRGDHWALCCLRGQGCLHLFFISQVCACVAPSPAVPFPISLHVKIYLAVKTTSSTPSSRKPSCLPLRLLTSPSSLVCLPAPLLWAEVLLENYLTTGTAGAPTNQEAPLVAGPMEGWKVLQEGGPSSYS